MEIEIMINLEREQILSMLPFVHYDIEQLQHALHDESSLYILDNMMLSKLRKDIVSCPEIVGGFHHSKVLVIPLIILQEAANNLPNEFAFRNMYYELFQVLSSEKEVHIVDFQMMVMLLGRMYGKQMGYMVLKNIVLQAVRINRDIYEAILKVNDMEQMENAAVGNGKNAGERFITIFSLLFIKMLYGPVYIVSEDSKGIYGAFKTFIANDRFLELMDLADAVELMTQYRFFTYEHLLQMIYKKMHWSKAKLQNVVQQTSRNESRVVLYSLEQTPCYTPISNEQLVEWIVHDRIHIQF